MMVNDDAQEILDLLRDRLEIPEHIDYLRLEIAVDQVVRIDCGYYPEKKQ